MKPMESRAPFQRHRLCWLCGMGMATLLYLCLLLFGAEMIFGTNDDAHIVRAFMGFETGQPPSFHIFIHALLTWPLRWLSLAFPSVAWFSVLQLALNWFACAVTVKCVVQCFLKNGHPLWAGLAASAFYLAAFAMVYCCQVTFTITAAMLGAAAVAQILSVDYAAAGDGAVVRGMALAVALLALAYALRQVAALPILGFCGLAFLFGCWQRRSAGKRSLRPFAWSLALVAVVMGGLMAQREWDIDANQMREHLRWQDATTDVLDYVGFKDVSAETIAELGWSDAERKLVEQWYMLDANITTEAYERLYAEQLRYVDQGAGGRMGLAAATLTTAVNHEWLAMRSVWLMLFVAIFCLAALIPRGRKRLWPALFVLATVLLAAAMLLYLASRGRMPLRAMLMPLLPAAGMLCCMLPSCLSPTPTGAGRALRAAGACVCAALTLWYAIPAAGTLAPYLPDEEAGETSIYADLFEFALDNPDLLVIHDLTLFGDTRMFPDFSMGVPHNLLCWGTWTARSPGMYSQLAAYGIDGYRFSAEDFLRENVCLATVVMDPPPQTLLDYLRAELGDGVDYSYDTSWGGVHIFTFYRTDE